MYCKMPKTMSGRASGFHNSFFQSLPYFYFEPVKTLIFHNISSMDIAAGIWFKLGGWRAPMIYFRHFPVCRFQNIKIYKDLYALQVLWSVGGESIGDHSIFGAHKCSKSCVTIFPMEEPGKQCLKQLFAICPQLLQTYWKVLVTWRRKKHLRDQK